MRSLSDVRSTFIDFFQKNGHEHVPSSPLVPRNDPTLMFTNAGMVQFKDVFTGAEKRAYNRATSSQKCVRAGGKHNDLENVGYTARHHTFFEMLGNFSFGDYFKEQAIDFAWTLSTKEFGLNPDRITVTVYHEDEESAALWKKISGIPEHRIIRIKTADNFWSMGDTGPCGPCTELFYDHGENIPGGPPGSPDEDGDRFTEFWNLVFMQYEQFADGRRVNLPKPSVDTGMGLERFSTIMQGVHNNYDTDLFQALIQSSVELTGTSDGRYRQSHNVIADHLRACSFLLADGVLPSNEGRGYVLRRIMRRGMRHAHLLGAKDPLMYRLVPKLVELMGSAYPELVRAQSMITENLKLEEERFRVTLDRGLKLLEDETSKLAPNQPLAGDVAFKLYDTYGFPLDLTQDMLKGQNRVVDVSTFDSAMEAQKAAARAAWVGSGEAKNEQIWYDLHEKHGATEFLGYDTESAEAVIQAMVHKGSEVGEAKKGETIQILCNQTPFYAESGGQEGDHGLIISGNGRAKVTNTLKMVGSLHVHQAEILEGTFKSGEAVRLEIDSKRRQLLRAHHSATHLLHAALRKHLGDHVTQKGSLVAQDRLRFDFTHTKALSHHELRTIEAEVNQQILANSAVETHLMSAEDAMKSGAMALFGEKYGDEVRVLSMGHEGDHAYSVELCGGTHTHRTGDIGLFTIISEAGVSAGVRRIEALAGEASYTYVCGLKDQLDAVTELLRSPTSEITEKLSALLTERKQLERQVADLRQKAALSGGGTGGASSGSNQASGAKQVGTYKVMSRQLNEIPAKDLKPLADQLKMEIGTGVIILTSVVEGKVALVIGVTDDITNKINAVDLVRIGAEVLGGSGGGGRPDMAQAGGSLPDKVPAAIEAIEAGLL